MTFQKYARNGDTKEVPNPSRQKTMMSSWFLFDNYTSSAEKSTSDSGASSHRHWSPLEIRWSCLRIEGHQIIPLVSLSSNLLAPRGKLKKTRGTRHDDHEQQQQQQIAVDQPCAAQVQKEKVGQPRIGTIHTIIQSVGLAILVQQGPEKKESRPKNPCPSHQNQ